MTAPHPHGAATPAPVHNRPGLPAIGYRIGDHARFRRAMVEALPRAKVEGREPLRPHTARDVADPAIALVDAWAAACDVLTFYQERIANGAYLRTAPGPQVARITALLGHRPSPGSSAQTLLAFTAEGDVPLDVPVGLRVQTVPDAGQKPATFETDAPVRIHRSLNRMALRATRPDPPAGGGTQAWLAGERTGLRAGDTVLLVADAAHWATRTLAAVEAGDGRTRIAWAEALPAAAPPMQVHAVERVARAFGHNAPKWDDLERAFKAAQAHAAQKLDYAGFVPKWGPLHFFETVPGTTTRPLDLDARYPVRPGTWAVLAEGPRRELFRVDAASEAARNDYLLSATVTRLATTPAAPGDPNKPFPAATSQLLLFGDPLPQAEAPAPVVRAGTLQLDLDAAYPELRGDRLLLLEGRRVRIHKGPFPPPVRFPGQEAAPNVAAADALRVLRVARPGGDAFALKAPGNHAAAFEPGDAGLTSPAPTAADACALVPAFLLYADLDGDGRFGPGDAAYLSSEAMLVATGPNGTGGFSLRLTPTDARQAGTVVRSGDPDLAAWATDVRPDPSPDGAPCVALVADPTPRLYVTPGPVGHGDPVPKLAIRLQPGLSGSKVLFGDQDHPATAAGTPMAAGGAAGERIEPTTLGAEAVTVKAVLRGPGGRTRVELASPLVHDYAPGTVALHGNVAPASHGETQRPEALGSGDASAAHQAFPLGKPPVTHTPDAAGEHGVRAALLVRVGGVEWTPRPTLHGAAPEAPAYTLQRTADGTFVRFGDGEAGARLPTGTHNVTATYRQGLGAGGNARPGQVRNLKDKPKGLKAATNPVPAEGGVDPEPPEATRTGAPGTVLTLDRIVSLRDFEDAARGHVGVAKARAALAWHGGERVVELTVAGHGDTRLAEGSLVRASLAAYLADRRDPHEALRLRAHDKVPLRITVRVTPGPRHDAAAVQAAARAVLLDLFDFASRGLGEPVHQSDLLAVLHTVAGVAGAEVLLLARGAAGAAPTVPESLPVAPHELATLDPKGLRVLLPGEAA